MRAGLAAAFLILVPAMASAQDYPAQEYSPWVSQDGSGLPNYAGLRGSFAFAGAQSSTAPNTAPPTRLRGQFGDGGGASLYIGTRLPAGFRVELEGLYRYLPFGTVVTHGATNPVTGRAQLTAPMVNLFWDVPVDEYPLRPFFGAGAGAAHVSSRMREAGSPLFEKSSAWDFSYDLMGGLEVPLSESARFSAMYRWLHVDGPDAQCGLGIHTVPTTPCKANLETQSVDFGVEMDMP